MTQENANTMLLQSPKKEIQILKSRAERQHEQKKGMMQDSLK